MREHAALRRYRWLLLAFPPDFRGVYGADLLNTFRDEWRDHAESSRPHRVAFWARATRDTVIQGLAERWARLTGRSRRPRPRRPLRDVPPGGAPAFLEAASTELRLALRALRRRPGFTAASVLILSLSLAAATTLWGTVYQVSLAPLGFRDESHLVEVWSKAPNGGRVVDRFALSDGLLLALQKKTRTLSQLGWFDMWAPRNGGVLEPDDQPPVRLPFTRVSTNFFSILGVRAALGRTFRKGEEGLPRVILSHRAWTTYFGGDPDVIGRSVRFRGEDREVIGVLPAGFSWPQLHGHQPDFFLPMRLDPTRIQISYFDGVGRIRPGVTLDQAEADASRIIQPLSSKAFGPGYWKGNPPKHLATVASLRDGQLGSVDARLRALGAAAAFLILLGVVNVSLLLLIRAMGRGRETAVRVALGGGRRRVVAPIVAEVAILIALAGVVGLALAAGALGLIRSLGPGSVPRLDQVALSLRVLAGGVGIAMLVALVSSTVPLMALRVLGTRGVLEVMAEGAGGASLPRTFRIPMLVAEETLAVTLLSGAALMARSLRALQDANLGFQAGGVLQGQLLLPKDPYWKPVKGAPKYLSIAPELTVLRQELHQRLAEGPGVTRVTLAMHTPLGPRYGGIAPFITEAHAEDGKMPPGKPYVGFNAIAPDFLSFMGVKLLEGRWLTRQDDADAPPVALVSQALARRFWPGEDPVGKRYRGWRTVPDSAGGFRDEKIWVTVVGVVPSLRERDLRDADETVYRTLAQGFPTGGYRFYAARGGRLSVFVRYRGDEATVARFIRHAVTELLPGTPVDNLSTMKSLVNSDLAEPRFLSGLFAAFGVLALLLAGGGVAAVVGFGVRSRTREIGLRVALGAWTREVLRLVARETLAFTALGVILGLVMSALGGHVLASILYQVPPNDPWSIAGAALIFTGIAGVAAWIPTRRALGIDPAEILRHE